MLSSDKENDPDIVGMIAASAALTLSGAPFMGPIGAARVGFVDGEYVLNPAVDDMEKLRNNPEQRLDLIVAGTKDAVDDGRVRRPTSSPRRRCSARSSSATNKCSR